MVKILFVCHGNICRSPMAEFVMKDLVRKAWLEKQFVIQSAATSREELGNPVCKNRHPSPICMQFGHHPAGVSAPLSRSEAPMPYNWFSTAIL